ncbi:ARABIDOPSIS THALIANA LIPID TRANSFER PROTEIN 1, lipid transfer protein 1, LIPID TRANSFER PROTEIN 1 [Hibiscus trionum]|uniref:Non-specific lipid-transfer protein n=1 Tax=Hibiscus trionum TaxID=183268 RepID=A0A9W7IBQ5_HIBTR|nr:ARABIDOPSIS THALIANA LIPID TRANSFER PROTEIN 1, lipid transfer protein 1, LIPID TRANSFER PROTEIN 1 [Hibiscus trionum]GMI93084.1 ARABIDOPSIS THALIANA LIPID TRANSFER PROTEIN 1, lipid transfer protein 1, LIPID TRANSFER PROTEIN 1 [Hibiscus trionum]
MSSSMSLKLACIVVLCLVVGAPLAQGTITCSAVTSSLSPCIAYLRSSGGKVPTACCNGVRNLNNAAQSTPDRQAACNCIKSASGSIPGINYGLASSLPGMCGVSIPYKISPSTDCKSVK